MRSGLATVGGSPRSIGRRSRPAILALGVTATVLVLAALSPTTARASSPGVYWGATIGTQFTGTQAPFDLNSSPSSVTDFEQRDAGGKQLSLVNWYSPFYDTPDCGGWCGFQTAGYSATRAIGAIPVISWSSQDLDAVLAKPQQPQPTAFTDAQIANPSDSFANQKLTTYITDWAKAAKAWGHPFFLRFDWEMNGSWFPWGVGNNDNVARATTSAAEYVAMWKYVHDIFASVGATNVTWVWCPNSDPANGLASLSSPTLYPGDNKVDWTCLDGYNVNTANWNGVWDSFAGQFASSYNTIHGLAPSKPLMVGETASTEAGGSKAAWISGMFTAVADQFPQIHGVLWWNTVGNGVYADSPIESSADAQSAFAYGVSSAQYASNRYGSLGASPIQPPVVSLPNSHPAAVRDPASGERWTFYVGSDGALWQWYWNGFVWANTRLGGEPVAPNTSPAAAWSAGSPVVYYAGSNGTVWSFLRSGSRWSNYSYGWEPVARGSSPAAIADPSSGNTWLYWVGADGHVYTSAWTGSWSTTSSSLGGESVAPNTSLALARTPWGAQDVYYVGTNGLIWEWTSNSSQSQWSNYAHTWESVAAGSSPTMVSDPSGDRWIFWAGADGHLYLSAWTGASWTASSSSLGGDTVAANSTPASAWSAGSPVVYYFGANGTMRSFMLSGSRWSSDSYNWEPGGQGGGPAVTADPSTGNTWVYWLGADGKIWSSAWTGSWKTGTL